MPGQTGTYRGMSAVERTAQRRAQLLDATLTRWAAAGVKVTMTAICTEAGLSERYFYESFTGLDAALRAVLDGVAVELETRASAAADAAGSEPVARMTAAVAELLALVDADPRVGRVALIESSAMPALRARRTELLRHFAHRVATDPGGGGEIDEVAGLLFVGGLAELVIARLDGVLTVAPDAVVEAAVRMILGVRDRA